MKCDLKALHVNEETGEETFIPCSRPRVQIFASAEWGRLGLCKECLVFVRANQKASIYASGEAVKLPNGEAGVRAPDVPLRLRRGILVCSKLPPTERT